MFQTKKKKPTKPSPISTSNTFISSTIKFLRTDIMEPKQKWKNRWTELQLLNRGSLTLLVADTALYGDQIFDCHDIKTANQFTRISSRHPRRPNSNAGRLHPPSLHRVHGKWYRTKIALIHLRVSSAEEVTNHENQKLNKKYCSDRKELASRILHSALGQVPSTISSHTIPHLWNITLGTRYLLFIRRDFTICLVSSSNFLFF